MSLGSSVTAYLSPASIFLQVAADVECFHLFLFFSRIPKLGPRRSKNSRMVKKLERLEMAWLKGFFTDIRYNFGTIKEREFRWFSL